MAQLFLLIVTHMHVRFSRIYHFRKWNLILQLYRGRFFSQPWSANKVFFVHPQKNGQAESTNKVILNRIKKKLDDTKGLWAIQLH